MLNVNDNNFSNPPPILLGRPFMSTAQTKIDVSKGTLIIEFDGKIVHFNIFDVMKNTSKSNYVFVVGVINKNKRKLGMKLMRIF